MCRAPTPNGPTARHNLAAGNARGTGIKPSGAVDRWTSLSHENHPLVGLNSDWVIAGGDLDVKNLLFEPSRSTAKEHNGAKPFLESVGTVPMPLAGNRRDWRSHLLRIVVPVDDPQQTCPNQEGGTVAGETIDGIVAGFCYPISNGPVAGFNSRIQAIKSPASGFRIFEHYRIRMLFLSGKPRLKSSKNEPRKSRKNPCFLFRPSD